MSTRALQVSVPKVTTGAADSAAIAAQRRLGDIQGLSHLWFAGAWTRYGFHEDGLMSGLAVAEGLMQRWAANTLAQAA